MPLWKFMHRSVVPLSTYFFGAHCVLGETFFTLNALNKLKLNKFHFDLFILVWQAFPFLSEGQTSLHFFLLCKTPMLLWQQRCPTLCAWCWLDEIFRVITMSLLQWQFSLCVLSGNIFAASQFTKAWAKLFGNIFKQSKQGHCYIILAYYCRFRDCSCLR